jgi:hypothetical protein
LLEIGNPKIYIKTLKYVGSSEFSSGFFVYFEFILYQHKMFHSINFNKKLKMKYKQGVKKPESRPMILVNIRPMNSLRVEQPATERLRISSKRIL